MLIHRIAVKIAFFINGFIYANWVSRLPRIQELYHIDNKTIGIILLISSLGGVGAMPFVGWAIIKKGSRSLTLFTAIAYCTVVPLIALMPGVVSLGILFLCMGITTGMLDVSMNAQAVMVEQQYKKPIMTSFHALFSIGMALGAWCGAFFSSLGLDLIYHFLTVVAIALVAVVWAGKNLIYDKPDPSVIHDGPLFRLPNKALISIGIITFCCMLGEGAVSNWSVNFMENIAKASESLAPIALSAFATAMTVGRIFGDRIRTKLGDKKMIVIGGLTAFFGLTTTLVVATPYLAIIGFFLVGAGLSSIVPIAYSIAGNTKSLPSGVGLAMVTTVGYSGFLLGPPLIGFIADWQTLQIALSIVAILFIVMTLLGIRYTARP